MKKKFVKGTLLVVLLSAQTVHSQHGHLNAGALGTNQNAQLYFANGTDFAAASGYVKTLTYTNGGAYANYFQGGITLTALPATVGTGGPDPAAPALGAFIQFSMSCLEGPSGGSFGFWEAGATNPSVTLAPGQTSTNLWPLTESDGSPGSDPYGHFHGRRFTATTPGVYKVGFKLFDTSTSGLGGGPIHTPSRELAVYFQAGVNVWFIEPDEDHTHIHFSAPVGNTWQVEVAASLGPHATWLPVENPVAGDDLFHQVDDDHPVQGQ